MLTLSFRTMFTLSGHNDARLAVEIRLGCSNKFDAGCRQVEWSCQQSTDALLRHA